MSAGVSEQSATVEATSAISDQQRNGSISGVAIVLGFSLNFTGTWTQGPSPWSLQTLLVMAFAVPGIVLQLRALFELVSLPVVNLAQHRTIAARFRLGIGVVLLAYVINTVFDAVKDLNS
jgi:hypothetical protein